MGPEGISSHSGDPNGEPLANTRRPRPGPYASARLAVLLGQFLGDFANQRPVAGSNSIPEPLLKNGRRGMFVAKVTLPPTGYQSGC